MNLISVFLLLAAFGVLIYAAVSHWNDSNRRKKMKQKEAVLINEQGVSPHGATLSHGMCENLSTGELVHDQKESLLWYKRLL